MTSFVCLHLDDDFESHVLHHLHRLEERTARLEQLAMTESAAQAAVDADVTSLQASQVAIAQDFANALAELKANNPTVDTTKLDAVAAQLASDAQADTAAVTPTPPAQPPAVTPPSDQPPAGTSTGTAGDTTAPASDGASNTLGGATT